MGRDIDRLIYLEHQLLIPQGCLCQFTYNLCEGWGGKKIVNYLCSNCGQIFLCRPYDFVTIHPALLLILLSGSSSPIHFTRLCSCVLF